jgi:F-type H+-transporting ATPase subunit b
VEIDWFTVGAQGFNFVLLAILLWFVLYRPVRNAVDRREEEIRTRMETARKKEEEAQTLMEEHGRKQAELEEEWDSRIREAEAEAEERRKELRRELRKEVEQARQEWRQSLRQERESFLNEFSEHVQSQVFAVIRQALEDLLDGGPAEAMVRTFLRQAREAPEEEREALVQALSQAEGACTIRTSLDLPRDEQDRIRDLLLDWVSGDNGEGGVEIEVEMDEEGPKGIEVWAGDRKMSWTVEAYVEGLREEVARVLDSETKGKENGSGERSRD